MAEFDQYRTRRVVGETAGDDHGAKLVVEAAVFSFGHAPTLTPGCSDPFGAADVERLTAHHRVHGTVELGLGLADHVLARGPRRDMGQQQLANTGLRRGPAGLGARQMQRGRAVRRVRPGGLAEENVGVASQLDELVADAGVTAVDERGPAGIGDPQTVGLGWVSHHPRHDRERAKRHRLTVNPVADIEDVRAVVDLAAVR